jgi:23S rRNA (guanosine2251-2'-O)-methyltransferase
MNDNMVRKLSTKEIHKYNKKRTKDSLFHETVVILDNIRSMHNVGSFFRTSDALGIKKLFLCGITPKPPRPEISKSALGAEEYVTWHFSENTLSIIKELKVLGYLIIGIEQTTESVLLHQFKLETSNKYALIFGNEVNGIHDDVLKECDFTLEIPQFGDKHSFNVSVSYGIVAYAFFDKFSI